MQLNDKQVKIIDRLIIFFFILFLLSITTSIFVNQIGYFGALLLVIARYFLTRENQFKKTGLEYFFIWFLLAELLSAIFCGGNPQAYLYFSKRALLIPLVYTSIAAAKDINRVKIYFKIYIGAALITVLIYLFFAYKYYIYNLYSIKESGPSIFQFPITAGEITCFTVIFLFAFAINEKTNIRNKILLSIGFLLSLAALISTYKRTTWTGVVAGIFIILLAKKQWKVLIPICLVIGALFLFSKNVSRVEIYNVKNSVMNLIYSKNTGGMAYDVLTEGGKEYVCDFNKGILIYKDTVIAGKFNLKNPAYFLIKWSKDYYVVPSVDTRFFLLKKSGSNFQVKNEFITSGFSLSLIQANNYLYVADLDSGLTIFRNPENLSDTARFREINRFNNLGADSSYLALFKPPNIITVFNLQNGLPVKKALEYSDSSYIDRFFYIDKKLFVSDKNGLSLYSIENDSLILLDREKSISRVFTWNFSNKRLFAADSKGNFFEFKYPVGSKIDVILNGKLSLQPQSIGSYDDKLIFTFAKDSRLLSIFNIYDPSNRGRIELWKAGLKMFLDHPVFGVGDIDLAQLYIKYKHNYDKDIQGHLHNNFFHELAVLGLFGFLAFCCIIIKIILIDLKIYKETKGQPFISSYALGTLGGFFAFLISGLTEYNFGDHEIITLVWFTLGFNIALYYFFKESIKNKSES